ncbi:relaxase/mobilization nuclease-like protein [Kitasatospora sp. SolWspMP-SS2h]|uniref:relaxase/mobilization nuclease domain-containing protein n=1 Tax=Kitasatospora sp. SolWspMP-SS2h TaxID=1305729 RepID=UPI000DBAA703|nr:relaxase/mobilization nuclease domain-containing protein [Kitasatospora sp. SolWspMP-SS2h]RAJ38625.1 relaxase/mobilization nuclease-like protein [Kitasatospora sp. SolWspMP-SS2h]
MISKAVHGNNTLGALRYLYGPGWANEHTDPHLVASWDGFAPDPGRDPHSTLAQLRDGLDLHVVQYGRKIKNHVYHRMVRADPTDRILTDDDWATVARRIVAAAGIAPDSDPDGCRWIAVRHADDHIHILATTVRADLTQARLRGDQYRVEAELTTFERQYRLKDLSDTRTRDYRASIPKRATGPELRKAQRQGKETSDRDRLRTAVRRALAGAASEEEFAASLAAQGVLLGVRRAPSGDVTGYKFALHTGDGTAPVWFSGSKLAADLTRPQIQTRFTTGTDLPTTSSPVAARYRASTTVDHTVRTLDDAPDTAQVAAVVSGGIEALDALALTSPVLSRKEINHAARALEYTAIARTRAARADLRAMRSAARELLYTGPIGGRGEEGAATATILSSLILLAVVVAKWHAAQGHHHQADAARTAAIHLRTAYGRHAAKPLAHLSLEGERLPGEVRDRQAAALRHALPADQAARVLADKDGWAALAATLAEAEAAGHDPNALLAHATGRRELASVDSAAAVLTWRIRRDTALPAPGRAVTPEDRRANAALSRSATGRTTTTPAPTHQPHSSPGPSGTVPTSTAALPPTTSQPAIHRR